MSPPRAQPRLATAADLPDLAALYADCARRAGPAVYTAEQVRAWASFGTVNPQFSQYVLGASTWLQAAPGGAPLAFCGADAQGELRSLYVHPDHQRQGLGGALLAHAVGAARAAGVQGFAAWATPFSRPLFLRQGWRLARVVREPYQGVLFDRYRMELP